ncbi:MAG TPA: site-2 protease family protein [Vicinamibacterales bacterium]|nr:site-2 protease family protein [Vicinamibacterales bacterium]
MPPIDVPALVIALLVLIFSLSVHEAAHAWSASRLGDDTARRLGRVTLNPVVHVDPIGTLLLPLIAMTTNAPLIGWAKPTPVNTQNLRHPRRDHILVTAAGPVSNLIIAIAAAAALRVMPAGDPSFSSIEVARPLEMMATQALVLNVLLAVFNMLPIPPLDGGQILMSLLPPHVAVRLGFLYQYGFLILMGLLFTGILGALIGPPYYVILSWLR